MTAIPLLDSSNKSNACKSTGGGKITCNVIKSAFFSLPIPFNGFEFSVFSALTFGFEVLCEIEFVFVFVLGFEVGFKFVEEEEAVRLLKREVMKVRGVGREGG